MEGVAVPSQDARGGHDFHEFCRRGSSTRCGCAQAELELIVRVLRPREREQVCHVIPRPGCLQGGERASNALLGDLIRGDGGGRDMTGRVPGPGGEHADEVRRVGAPGSPADECVGTEADADHVRASRIARHRLTDPVGELPDISTAVLDVHDAGAGGKAEKGARGRARRTRPVGDDDGHDGSVTHAPTLPSASAVSGPSR